MIHFKAEAERSLCSINQSLIAKEAECSSTLVSD